MTQLPQEILDLIVDQLASQDSDPHYSGSSFQALKLCSLCSRALRGRSRDHLFSHVALKYNTHHLSPASEYRRLSGFKDLLDGDRNLVRCIKSLEIWVDEFSLIGGQHTPLSDIITILYSTPPTSLHVLTLRGSRYRPVSWSTIPDYLQAALYNVCQSGSLDSLELHYLRNIPLQILWTAHPSLTFLSIVDATFTRLTSHPELHVGTFSSYLGSHVALKRLSVDRSFHDLLPAIQHPPKSVGGSQLLASISTFHFIINHEDIRRLPEEFLSSLRRLSSLSIFIDTCPGPGGLDFEFCAYPALTRFGIRFEVSTLHHATMSLNLAFQSLSQKGRSNGLEDIRIHVDLPVNILDAWNSGSGVKNGEIRWAILDTSLSDGRYEKLKRCEVVIQWDGMDLQADDTCCQWLQQYFSPPSHLHPAIKVTLDFKTI